MPALPDLVTPADLAAFIGVGEAELGRRGELLCALASAAVRNYVRKPITLVTDDSVDLPAEYIVKLPSWPVTAVASVALGSTTLASDGWSFTTSGFVYISPVAARLSDGAYLPPLLTVVYSHGFPVDSVPPDIFMVALQCAARGWANPDALRSESIGSYSVTYSGPEAPGGLLMSYAEQRVLDAHKAY